CFIIYTCFCCLFFFSSRRRHTRSDRDWSSDVCSSDLALDEAPGAFAADEPVALDDHLALRDDERGGTLDDGAFVRVVVDAHVERSEERRVGKECRCGWWPDD